MRRNESDLPADQRGHVALARGLAAHAGLMGMRQVVLSPTGATVADGQGRSVPATWQGATLAGMADGVHAALRLANTSPYGGDRPRSEDELDSVDFGDHGTWRMSRDGDTVTLTADKPGPTCVDALLPGPADAMAEVRALYGKPGVDIVVACAGRTRSRDMARAIASETGSLGLPFTLAMPKPWDRPRGYGHEWSVAPIDATPGPPVVIRHLDTRDFDSFATTRGEAPDGARVTVGEPGRWISHRMAAMAEAHGDRPVAMVSVTLSREDSKPRLETFLSPGARSLLSEPTPMPADAPWETLAARRGKHHATRTPKPKTWHSTTDQVAEAYVAREAPRGRVSGDTLFFHGPILWSLYRNNPIAAYVTDKDGETFVLEGRSVTGGTKGGTVSSAIGDLHAAAKGRVRFLNVRGDMSPFLRWGDMGVGQAWAKVSRGKSEGDMPRDCTVDGPALSAWLAAAMGRATAEQLEAYKSAFPTARLFGAINDRLRLHDLRETLGTRLGLDLAPIGDRSLVQGDLNRANATHAARTADIAARKAARAEAAAPAGPSP